MRKSIGPWLVSIGLAGCGTGAEVNDGLARKAISGTVTLDGQPLDSAQIQFIPTDPSSGGGSSGAIQEGRFEIAETQGPPPGTYRVVISSQAPVVVEEGEMPGEAPPPSPEKLPAKYNRDSTLNATVEAEGANTFEFALESK